MAWWEQNEWLSYIFDEATHDVRGNPDRLEDSPLTLHSLETLYEWGWLDTEVSPDVRQQARELFFEWMEDMGFDDQDFDWDAWREWYETQ